MNRIAGGNPPTAMQWPVGAPTRELNEQGLLTKLDDLAAAGNWQKTPAAADPAARSWSTAISSARRWTSTARTGCSTARRCSRRELQPPKTWDEFFAQAPKLQAAGYIPLAYGANAQQEGWLFMALLAGIAGSETYMAIAVAA